MCATVILVLVILFLKSDPFPFFKHSSFIFSDSFWLNAQNSQPKLTYSTVAEQSDVSIMTLNFFLVLMLKLSFSRNSSLKFCWLDGLNGIHWWPQTYAHTPTTIPFTTRKTKKTKNLSVTSNWLSFYNKKKFHLWFYFQV